MIDKQVEKLIHLEAIRHKEDINLIASENYPSKEVLEACGSIFSTKYAEGYPGKRYYEGCEVADEIETLAINRAKDLFNCDHVNVQPHSGTQANMAVYLAVLNSNDSVLSMRLDQGGHLSHGSKVNFSGKIYNFNFYGVDRETEMIDYDEVENLAKSVKPKLIVCGASAYSRIIDFDRFSKIAKSVGALLLSDVAHISGLIAGKVHPNPIQFSDFVTTTTHKTLRGPRSGMIFSKKELSEKINFAVFPALQGGPHNNVISAVAIALKEASEPKFKEYILNVKENAKTLGEHMVSLGYNLSTNGTDNHLLLINLKDMNITGSKIEYILEKVDISVNKNAIIGDKSAMSPGGIRIGLCAMTTRCLKKENCSEIANLIHRTIQSGIKIQGDGCKLDKFKDTVDLLIQNNLSDINNIIDLEPNQSKLLNSFIGGIKSLSEELKSIKKDVNEFSKQFTFNYKI